MAKDKKNETGFIFSELGLCVKLILIFHTQLYLNNLINYVNVYKNCV